MKEPIATGDARKILDRSEANNCETEGYVGMSILQFFADPCEDDTRLDGARRWYASGFPPLPPTVDADTRNWRKQADRILGFWDECPIADRGACIATADLQHAFNTWMQRSSEQVELLAEFDADQMDGWLTESLDEHI